MANLPEISILILLIITCLLSPTTQDDTDNKNDSHQMLTNHVPKLTKTTLNTLTNPIDSCWRGKPNWAASRRALADCAVGYGSDALGGKQGEIYTVTSTADDPVDPQPGTLRYGAIRDEPLWIVFADDMVIRLKSELMVNSYKTIDGRGVDVEIANGPCITVHGVSHVIIHGISVHDCEPGNPGRVRSSPSRVGNRVGSDGDAITVFDSSHVWIDHCFLSKCSDGLIDVTYASNYVTISNNYFTQHDKVILLGHNDDYTADKVMKVTLAFNHFGPGLYERMPRVRFGYAHVANNRYDGWKMYAIGGSANPTIFSEGNYFDASDKENSKLQVTKRPEVKEDWTDWKWRSSKDVFLNGAFFVQSGWGTCNPLYTPSQSFRVYHGSFVPYLTNDAGPLSCVVGKPC